MGKPVEVLEAELLKLPKADRIRVLDRVVNSLDADAARDAAWDAAAARRDAEADHDGSMPFRVERDIRPDVWSTQMIGPLPDGQSPCADPT